jgi:hypothetical protein
LVGCSNFKEYLILGDDVVIADPIIGEQYITLLSSLGIKVRLQKTIKSFNKPYSCEFASQLLKDKEILSPLPMGLIKEGSIESLFSF